MKTILLIDDDQDLLTSFQVTLEDQGFKIMTANNGEQGYSLLIEKTPDLLVLDVMMESHLEGYNLLHRIKKAQEYKELPVILLTGMSEEIGVNLYSGVDDENVFPNVHFQDKPIDPIKLGEMINKMLEQV